MCEGKVNARTYKEESMSMTRRADNTSQIPKIHEYAHVMRVLPNSCTFSNHNLNLPDLSYAALCF